MLLKHTVGMDAGRRDKTVLSNVRTSETRASDCKQRRENTERENGKKLHLKIEDGRAHQNRQYNAAAGHATTPTFISPCPQWRKNVRGKTLESEG